MWKRVKIDVKLSMKKERVKSMSYNLEGENSMQMATISRQGYDLRVGGYSVGEEIPRMPNLAK